MKRNKFFEKIEQNAIKIFENFPFPFLISDKNGRIIFFNSFFLKIVNNENLINKNIRNFFNFEEDFKTINLTSKHYMATYKVRNTDNPEKVYSVNIQKLDIEGESFLQFFFQDISIEFNLFKQLEIKNKLIENELSTAKKVLDQIFYISPIYNSYIRFESFFKPSEKLGGDFFDIFQIDDDKIGVLIADVSGHGVSSSLITATLKMLITLTPNDFYNVDRMISYINSTLLKILIEDQFVTLFYGIIDTKTNEIEYINCGHPMPIVFSEKDKKVFHLEKVTFPLGINLNLSYSKYIAKEKLPDFCKILFYTDGLFSFHKDKKVITIDELKNLFIKTSEKEGKNVLNKIYFQLLSNYDRFEEDDISMLLVLLNKNFVYKNYFSLPSNILEADNAIIKIMSSLDKNLNLEEDTRWKIYTSLYEALLNAIIHGNKSNIHKRVTISYRIFKNWIVFKVKDEGQGFDHKKIANPLEEENLLKASGRGVFMIKKIMNRVKFNSKGNEISMFLKVD